MPRKNSSTVATIQTAVPVELVSTNLQQPLSTPILSKEVLASSTEPQVKKQVRRKKVVTSEPVVSSNPVDEITPTIVKENIDTNIVLDGEPIAVEPIPVEPVGDEEKTSKRTRRVVNKDTLRHDWEFLFTEYAEELQVKKRTGQKLSLDKFIHKLQNDTYKLLKIRPEGDEKKPRSENAQSGFMKPVNITPELASFINVDVEVPITRVLITKKICEYIKEKDLQNPKDRREIVPDPSMKRIFKLEDNSPEPLTYYSMQKKIQSHILKT